MLRSSPPAFKRSYEIRTKRTLPTKATIKKRRNVPIYRSTRSVRPSSLASNLRFEWVEMPGYPFRPSFIHPAKKGGSHKEIAQVITTSGELCQKTYEFKHVSVMKQKPAKFVVALNKFNKFYGTSFE